MPHAAAGVAHVARIPRNHVHMHMRHGLARGRPGVKADVVSIGLRVKPLVEQGLHLAHEFHERHLLCGRALEERGHHPPRDHKHVARRHWVRVEDREAEVIRADPLRLGDFHKRRGGGGLHGRQCTTRRDNLGPGRPLADSGS